MSLSSTCSSSESITTFSTESISLSSTCSSFESMSLSSTWSSFESISSLLSTWSSSESLSSFCSSSESISSLSSSESISSLSSSESFEFISTYLILYINDLSRLSDLLNLDSTNAIFVNGLNIFLISLYVVMFFFLFITLEFHNSLNCLNVK